MVLIAYLVALRHNIHCGVSIKLVIAFCFNLYAETNYTLYFKFALLLGHLKFCKLVFALIIMDAKGVSDHTLHGLNHILNLDY